MSRRDEAATVVVVAALLCLLGSPLGLVWAALAPHLDYLRVLNDGFFTGFQAVVGGDLAYFGVCAVAGLLVGALVRLAAASWFGAAVDQWRHRTAVVVGLVVGGELAALVASRVGTLVRARGIGVFASREVAMGYTRPDVEHYFVPVLALEVHARLLLGVLPALALLAYLAVTALQTRRR